MLIYGLASNQESISSLTKEINEHRRKMLYSSVQTYSEYAVLARKNLKVSVARLGKVIGPALLSALPVLVIAGWLEAYHGYALPEGSKMVALTFFPPISGSVKISPPELVRSERGVLMIASPVVHPITFSFSANGKDVYSGDPFLAPTPVIEKKGWLNLILPTGAGYIYPGSPIDEIRFDLPRKLFFKGFPLWLSGWEFPYFFSVLVATLTTKLLFKIH